MFLTLNKRIVFRPESKKEIEICYLLTKNLDHELKLRVNVVCVQMCLVVNLKIEF